MALPASSSTPVVFQEPSTRMFGSRRGCGLDRPAAEADLLAHDVDRERLGRAPAHLALQPDDVVRRGVRQGIPLVVQLPKKISPNDPPMMARMPQLMSDCGACSREEPQPKFAPDDQDARRPGRPSG